ncbi:hypothetical protein BWD13_05475 [Leptospira santarosai serovar Grippotyphosa]|nr:hypothetical protein BWD13_05475 [Leptospira santarosai serovar Grippotyphosa]
MLWKSPSMQDNSLHTMLANSLNYIGNLYRKGKEDLATELIVKLSECNEAGLGNSKTRRGKLISSSLAHDILNLYKIVPQISSSGLIHIEEIQLLTDNVSKDRISDLTCNFLKSFLIDYTIDQSKKYNIPIVRTKVENIFDYKAGKLIIEDVDLPINPINESPILLIPKRWLRQLPWINYDDFFKSSISKLTNDLINFTDRISVLNFNRANYDQIETYVKIKEKQASDCKNDPLFKQLPILSITRKLSDVLNLPTGNAKGADKNYEDYISKILATVFYPHLDFATTQSRSDSGVLIRDLIFYNNTSYDFLKDIYNDYSCKQVVFELKNVQQVEREHINQLNRYLSNQFGRFGILFTRNKTPKNIYKNTIDLWAGQRKCILIFSDEDLKLMCNVYTGKQRNPIDVIKMKYIEFMRDCPS